MNWIKFMKNLKYHNQAQQKGKSITWIKPMNLTHKVQI